MRAIHIRLACFVIALAASVITHAQAEEAPEGARGAALTFAKKAIRPTLKDPSSADFEWASIHVDRVLPVKNADDAQTEIVIVSGIVRAKNSFNAIVPSEWEVVMLHDSENYEAMVVTNGGQFVLKTDKGEKFLNILVERRKKQDEKRRIAAAEKARLAKEEAAAKAAEKARLEKASKAGHEAGHEAVQRFVKRFGKQKLRATADELIDKNARNALKDAGITEADESQRFLESFAAAFREAKDSGK
jgi:hypothetical protein